MLLDYVRLYTSLHWAGAPIREGVRFRPRPDHPFGSFSFEIGVPTLTPWAP